MTRWKSGLLLALEFVVLLNPLNSPLGRAAEPTAVRDMKWDAVFRRHEGWTGGDGAYSISLGDGRTLWTFGDTWIGKIENGRHASGSRLVNNSVAVHPTPTSGGAPRPDQVQFFWGAANQAGQPRAWIRPAKEIAAMRAADQGGETRSWYWLADGLLVPKKNGRDRLILFLWHIGRKPKAKGVWSFQSLGGAMAVISNPHDPLERWSVRRIDNPHAIGAARAARNPGMQETSWGSEVLLMPPSAKGQLPEIYIFGVREAGEGNKQLLLARATANRIEDFGAWQFRGAGDWVDHPCDAVSLAERIVNEFSISPVTNGQNHSWIMVHSEPWFGARIMIRRSSRVEGPWSKPQPVFRVDELKRDKSYFTYAAKAHADLSRPGELLISYVVNAHRFGAMVADAGIYRPRFVRLRLKLD